MEIPRVASLVPVLFGLLLMTGCVTPKPADFTSPLFQPAQVDRLVLLPVLDHRVARESSFDLDAKILPIAADELARLGYSHTIVRDRALVQDITRDDFDAPSPEWIGTLGPASSRYVMTLVLEESSSSLTFGSTGTAETMGYLFDKESRTLLWKNKALARVGQGGLLGMAMRGMMEGAAIDAAARQMFQSLPAHHGHQ